MIADERVTQNFYCIDQKFAYFLRGEFVLEDTVDPQILEEAVKTAFLRFPYFSAKLTRDEHGYIVVHNDAPPRIICDNRTVTLNSPEVNGHLISVSCHENTVIFNICHCITDGGGVMPFIKTVFYYYVTRRYGTDLDPEGIYLTDTPVFPDENTVPEKETEITPQGAAAGPAALKNQIYRLSQSPDVQDDIRTEYRFTTDAARFMELCRANGTSPNAMVSSLLARAVWREDPQLKEDVVINLCVDMRTALECPHNHSNLTTCVPIIFDASMKDISLPEICAGARKTMIAGARPEIIRSVYEKSAAQADKIQRIKKEDLKKKVMQSHLHGPGGFFNCTVLLSYWGPNSLESLEPYIKGLFTTIDFIPEGGMAVEFSCKGEKFCFSFMQDFSSDAYAGLFKHELEELGLKVENEVRMPMPAIRIDLPC